MIFLIAFDDPLVYLVISVTLILYFLMLNFPRDRLLMSSGRSPKDLNHFLRGLALLVILNIKSESFVND